jgi:hypothetical protein
MITLEARFCVYVRKHVVCILFCWLGWPAIISAFVDICSHDYTHVILIFARTCLGSRSLSIVINEISYINIQISSYSYYL